MRHDDVVASNDDARIDGALGGDEAPHFFARLRLDGMDASVSEARDEQPQAVDGGDRWRGVRRVVGTAARIGDIDHVAGTFVERDEAVARAADAPQFDTAALTMTRSPSTIGDIVRPPCVVNAANSSPNDRSHSRLPSRLSAMTSAPPLSA